MTARTTKRLRAAPVSGAVALPSGAAPAGSGPDEATLQLMRALASTHVGFCLCDETDTIRFVNEAFRQTFIPHYRGGPALFVEIIAEAIAIGHGIRLETLPLAEFIRRVAARRSTMGPRFDFSVDCSDGSWWWVNDHRMPNGWILAVATEMSSIKHQELALRHAHAVAVRDSQTDFLTGLANRRSGVDQAQRAVDACKRGGPPLAVAVVDIDHFKCINDTHGHDVGDKVLVHFAQSLRRQLRCEDQLSRIGGEEFLLVLPGLTAAAATAAVARLLRTIPPFVLAPRSGALAIEASAGVAAARPGLSLQSLLTAADTALYEAKAKGRRRVEAAVA